MKSLKPVFIWYLFILTGFLPWSYQPALADGVSQPSNQTLVFDPQTKKYFIGGQAKFRLRPDATNALVDGIQVSVDGGDYQPYVGEIQFGVEGKHTIKFRALNAINNWSPVQLMEVFVDMTPPVTEANFTEGKFFHDETMTYVQSNSKLTLSAQDNLSGVQSIEYSWDGTNFRSYSDPIVLDKQGPQTLYYRAIDRVGNMEATKKLAFYTDGTPPFSTLKQIGTVKPITIEGKGYLSANDSVSFAIDATDEGSKVKDIWVSIDGQPYTTFKKPIYFLQEGPHTMKYFGEDKVGNKEEAKSVAIYTISAAPSTTATAVGKMVNTGGINYATRRFQLKLWAKDNVVGLDRIEYKLNGEMEFHSYLEPIRFQKTGMQTVAYHAVDRAGNYEPTKVFNVTIQEQAPETTIETAQPLVVRDGISYSPAPNVVTLNVENSEVGVDRTMVSVNDMPFKDYAGPITLTADKKVYKIAYKSTDKLGNEEQPKVAVYHMLNTIPLVDMFISNGKNGEEQVRTKYFDDGSRNPASVPDPNVAKPTQKKMPQ